MVVSITAVGISVDSAQTASKSALEASSANCILGERGIFLHGVGNPIDAEKSFYFYVTNIGQRQADSVDVAIEFIAEDSINNAIPRFTHDYFVNPLFPGESFKVISPKFLSQHGKKYFSRIRFTYYDVVLKAKEIRTYYYA